MKHRSVIAFVIVAAALFAAPQLSHDLQTFKSALGSRLRGELMQVFLSLPACEGGAAVVAPRPAETLLASCTKEKQATKPGKSDPAPAARAGVRAAERAGDESAMIVEPLQVSEPWVAALAEAPLGAAELPRRASDEVAMIIPPDSGIDPRGLARVSEMAARDGERQAFKFAADVRVAYAASRSEAKGPEWRKADEALRRLEEAMPGAYEFRVERDGSKAKVLKVKRIAAPCCPRPVPAPRAPRPAGMDAATAPLPVPSVGVVTTFISE
jgi:hypothetical protein